MGCEKFFHIKSYFCCWSLKTGSFIIAYLGLFHHFLQTANVSSTIHSFQNTLIPFLFQSIGNNTELQLEVYKIVTLYTELMAIITAYHVLSVVFQLVLIWGLHKSSREFLLPWLVIEGFKNVAIVVGGIILAIFYMTKLYISVGYLFITLGIFVLYCCLFIYSYMCVYSHYLNIKFTPEPQMIKDIEKDIPPTYINSFIEDKKHDI